MSRAVKITPQQLKRIWAIGREKGIDADQLREMANTISGKPSLSGLTKNQANSLLDWLKKGINPDRASSRQLWKISEFEKELGWVENPSRMNGFISKYAHVDRREWLTKGQAKNVIDGLKNLLARQSA